MQTAEGSWEEFEDWLKGLRKSLDELRENSQTKSASPLLFRGLASSEWKLTTTLERSAQERWSFTGYYNLITARIGPAVETFTGVKVPKYDPELGRSFNSSDSFYSGFPGTFPPDSLYQYMVYLRHHGFPSPLLDWSSSPYVAAFFAFRSDQPGSSEKRSIYVYCEMPSGSKGGAVGEPTIHPIGPYVRSHRRHFRQQSDYTICGSWDSNIGWCFDSHQSAFDHARPDQDFLWKFDIPSEERVSVLRLLDRFNLNAFSLFDSEETLLETMWLREKVFPAKGTIR